VAIPPGTTGNLDYLPIGIALDASGRIYIANGADNSILVYPARSGSSLAATPSATIAGSMTTLNDVNDVAVDASGKIYAVDQNTPMAVKVFAANPSGLTNEAPIAQITGSQTQIVESPNSVAVDHLGIIYVGSADQNGYSAILEFPATPSGTLNEAPMGMLRGAGRNPGGLVAK
jgi:sugar lactone lactonase YvrE